MHHALQYSEEVVSYFCISFIKFNTSKNNIIQIFYYKSSDAYLIVMDGNFGNFYNFWPVGLKYRPF